MREAIRRSRAEVKRKVSFSFCFRFDVCGGFTDFFSNRTGQTEEGKTSIIVGSAASCLLRVRYLRGTLDSKHL